MPNRLCIEAIAGLLLVQVPPGVASASEPNAPTHKTELPVIGAGGGNTVMPIDEEQPVGNVYTIVTGPALTPVNMPVAEPTDAVAGLVLDHVPPPPPEVLTIVAVAPGQTVAGPEIVPAETVFKTVSL